jgi:glutamine cyclotransferase
MAFQVMSGFMSIIVLVGLVAMPPCVNASERIEAVAVAAETPNIPNRPSTTQAPPVYGYRVIRSYPHDRQAFTQGLVYEAGELYEGTGIRGQSSLRRVALETGTVRQARVLPEQYFGEGITTFGDRIIQLTWQSRIGFVYDKASFQLVRQFRYPTEGWGITHDGSRLILSDGTSNLYFLEPETFTEIARIEVHDDQGPVDRLNELEYVRGDVYANVWQTDRIARIDLLTGRIAAWIDLAGLLSAADRQQRVDVLNGIAYDAENDRLFVTGKWWPKLFEVQIVPHK